MNKLAWISWTLVLTPLLGFGALSILHPVGDPQDSGSAMIRLLDFLGTYGIRTGAFWPPPLLILGAIFSWAFQKKEPMVRAAAWTGTGLLILWGIITLVPYLVHVN